MAKLFKACDWVVITGNRCRTANRLKTLGLVRVEIIDNIRKAVITDKGLVLMEAQ